MMIIKYGWAKRVFEALYGNWYGASVLFLMLALILPFACPCLDVILPNGLILGKDWAAIVFVLAFGNLLISVIVSAIRRNWRLALGKFLLMIPQFFVLVFSGVMLCCSPCRKPSAPSISWTSEHILAHMQVKPEQLVFRGGVESREPIVVFEVLGSKPAFDADGFVEDTTHASNSKIRYGKMFLRFRNPIVLAEPIRLRAKYTDDGYWLEVLESGSRTFVIYVNL